MSKKRFSSSREVFDWLGQFVNLEQGVKPPSMRPERMQIIARAAGNPENAVPAIHVAGSKGKGSVTAMVSAMLAGAGYKVGRYMSPHITEYRERITLNNDFFNEDIYINAAEQLYQVEKILAGKDTAEYHALVSVSEGGGAAPTFFELLTLYFFLCAKEAKCTALAIETGMGGRLDPTNISQSRAVVITGIEFEHTDMLGDTIAKIAFEKAGIIKQNTPVILAEQLYDDALAVFTETAKSKHAELCYFPEIAGLANVAVTKNGTAWSLCFKNDRVFSKPLDLSIALAGEVQAVNTSLAILAVKKAFPDISAAVIQNAVRSVTLPARFECVCRTPEVIVDGAHTDISVQLCVKTWQKLYGNDGVLLFGCATGKDAAAMAKTLFPCFSKIIITTPGTYKTSEPQKVFEIFKNAAPENKTDDQLMFIEKTEDAIRSAFEYAEKNKLPVLGTGSFYLAAEIRNYLNLS